MTPSCHLNTNSAAPNLSRKPSIMGSPMLLHVRVHHMLDVPRIRTAGDSMLCCRCSSIVTFSLIGAVSLLLPTCKDQHTIL